MSGTRIRAAVKMRAHAAAMASARRLGRSPVGVHAAIGLRNLAQNAVAASLTDGQDPRGNGEQRLIDAYGPSCRVVVDVGANVGDWSAAMLERAESGVRAVLFEPSIAARIRLERRFGDDSRVQVVAAAVADEPTIAVFYEEADGGERSTLVAPEQMPGATGRQVRVTTLDDELPRLGLTRVDFLKIDAEGYDLHVLRGAERLLATGSVDVIQFEYNRPWLFVNSTLGEALGLLERHALQVYLLRGNGLHRVDYVRAREFFAYANFVALSAQAREQLSRLLVT